MEIFDEIKTVGNITMSFSNRIRKLKNVIVARHGIILDHKFNRIPDANQHFNFWSQLWAPWWVPIKSLPEDMMEIVTKPIVELEDDHYIYGLHYHDSVQFGHIWDIAQSLHYVNCAELHGKLLCNWQADIPDVDFHWSAFGYGSDSRTPIDTKNYNYLVPVLYVPSMPELPGQIRGELIEWLRGLYLRNAEIDNVPRKLYLSRSKNKSRHILNEEELLPIIEKHGYTVLHGDEGIKTHINYFYSATKIIGFLGSLMRNCLFCSSNPRMVEYCSHDYFTDVTIKSIAEAVGVEWYRKISLEQVGNFDIVIEPWFLDKLLVNLDPDLKEDLT